jgi:hypothetical protein
MLRKLAGDISIEEVRCTVKPHFLVTSNAVFSIQEKKKA